MDQGTIHDVLLEGLEDALVGLAFNNDLALLSDCEFSELKIEVMCIKDDVDVPSLPYISAGSFPARTSLLDPAEPKSSVLSVALSVTILFSYSRWRSQLPSNEFAFSVANISQDALFVYT